jgi:putative phage-type endonuclease
MPELNSLVPLSEEWHKLRSQSGVVTASVIGTLLGINTYTQRKTKKDIQSAFEILKDPSKNTFKGNVYCRYGQTYEDHGFHAFEKITTMTTRSCNQYQSPTHPWLYATPDRIIIDPSTGKDTSLLEIKNPFKDAHEEVPLHYYAQVQFQLHCANMKTGYFVSLSLKSGACRGWRVDYCPDFFSWAMKQLCYLHNAAKDAVDRIDLGLFDKTPPKLKCVHLFARTDSLVLLKGLPMPTFDGNKWTNEPGNEVKDLRGLWLDDADMLEPPVLCSGDKKTHVRKFITKQSTNVSLVHIKRQKIPFVCKHVDTLV